MNTKDLIKANALYGRYRALMFQANSVQSAESLNFKPTGSTLVHIDAHPTMLVYISDFLKVKALEIRNELEEMGITVDDTDS